MRQVAAAVIIEDGRLLLARRARGEKLAGMWELPGGKVEPGETVQECLVRELLEELSMTAEVREIITSTVYTYDHGSFEMLALETRRTSGFRLSVHDDARLVGRRECESLNLAPADIALVTQLAELNRF
jgi:8-oxo-dGTP diphosphatase